MRRALTAAMVVLLAGGYLASAQAACPPASAGNLIGGDTADNLNFPGRGGGTYTLGVRAKGDGNNTLTVKVQEKKKVAGWRTLDTIKIDLGDSVNGCRYGSAQYTYDGDRDLRYRFTRKIGTSGITYDWDHDFTVLWGGASHRCLVCN